MNIPQNGRIAIVDDNIDQALPLINVLAQKRCPYSYFSGEVKFLPKEDEKPVDIRILFLDINLIDDKVHPDKELKARLVPVLSRILSKDNYPYILIYWSRNEAEHASLVKEIFENDLSDRKPIDFLSQNKLGYFNLDGSQTEDFNQNVATLFENIAKLFEKHRAYSYLINWENEVHVSADKTLQEIFSSGHAYDTWTQNANYLINKLGESYAGRSTFKSQNPPEKIRSSFQAFNNVFYDTLEYLINNADYSSAIGLEYDKDQINTENIFSINKKLIISDEKDIMEYSGSVIEDCNPKSDKAYEDVLNNAFNRNRVFEIVKTTPEHGTKEKKEIDKLVNQASSEKRKQIRASWKKIYFVVTPLCDFVQAKTYNVRVIKGMIIKEEFLSFIDDKSEAIFISPKFKFGGEVVALVLHFRYFFTSPGAKGVKSINSLFRVRQQLLSEVQSKLARHVSRQGVLFLE